MSYVFCVCMWGREREVNLVNLLFMIAGFDSSVACEVPERCQEKNWTSHIWQPEEQ